MIFFILLCIGVGAIGICASIWGMTPNTPGERLLIASFGAISFVLAGVYAFLELLVIRNFPKYPKLRRILFNSDIYFTDSTSDEYFGRSRTIRGHGYKLAFEMVTAFAGVEKRMGNKVPVRYKIYSALATVMALFELVFLFVTPVLFDKGIVFPNMSDGIFCTFFISIAVVCIAFAIFFLFKAFQEGIMAPSENDKWTYELYTSLVDLAVRKNNKKHKFWYDRDQLKQIESLVKSASEHAELKLETRKNKIVSFTVIDTLDNRVRFKGSFI